MAASSPDGLDREHTLTTAAARFDHLRTRAAMAATAEEMAAAGTPQLTREELLELLALSEVIARKAGYGRQLDVRAARRAGASWTQIGAALGTSKQSAWEAHTRWIDAAQRRNNGYGGMDDEDAAAARRLAGDPDDDAPG